MNKYRLINDAESSELHGLQDIHSSLSLLLQHQLENLLERNDLHLQYERQAYSYRSQASLL